MRHSDYRRKRACLCRYRIRQCRRSAGKVRVRAPYHRIIEQRGLTQVEAAKLLGINEPKVSALKRGRITEFSIDRLMRFLVALGQGIDIRIRPASHAGLKVAHFGNGQQRLRRNPAQRKSPRATGTLSGCFAIPASSTRVGTSGRDRGSRSTPPQFHNLQRTSRT